MQKLLQSIQNLQQSSHDNRKSCDSFLQAMQEWSLTEELYGRNMERISRHEGLQHGSCSFIRDYTKQAANRARELSDHLSANVIEYFKQLLTSQSNSVKSNFIESQKIMTYIKKKCELVSETMNKYFNSCRECEEIAFELDKETSLARKEKIFQKMSTLKKESDVLLSNYSSSISKFNTSRDKILKSIQKLISSYNSYESQRTEFFQESLELIDSTLFQISEKSHKTSPFDKSLIKPSLYDLSSFEIIEVSLETYDGSHPLFQNLGTPGFHFSLLESTGVAKGTQIAIEELYRNEIEEIITKAWNGKELSSEDYVKVNTRLREPIGRKVWSWTMNSRRNQGDFSLSDSGFTQIGELMLATLNECERTEDINIAKNCIILSQTFYKLQNGKKVFLQHFIMEHTLWKKIEFWEQVVNNAIEEELKKGSYERGSEDALMHEKHLVFCQLVSFGNIMMSFGLRSGMESLVQNYAGKYEFGQDELRDIMASVIESLQSE